MFYEHIMYDTYRKYYTLSRLVIDNDLNWNEHAQNILMKIN